VRSRILVPYSIRRSDAALTVSDFSRREICGRYAIPATDVHTIPIGINPTRFFHRKEAIETVESLGLKTGAYFLTVGRQEPRKDHAALLRAWALLPRPRPQLVIVGQRHFNYGLAHELISNLQLERKVKILDQIPDTQLPAVYRGTRGFLYASLSEGFDVPFLEAMASGVSVISSANSALGEVGADADLWVYPKRPEKIACAVLILGRDLSLREAPIERGLSGAREFTWDASVYKVRSVYLSHFRHPAAVNADSFAAKPA